MITAYRGIKGFGLGFGRRVEKQRRGQLQQMLKFEEVVGRFIMGMVGSISNDEGGRGGRGGR